MTPPCVECEVQSFVKIPPLQHMSEDMYVASLIA